MSAQEILAEINKLSPEERQEIEDGLAGFKGELAQPEVSPAGLDKPVPAGLVGFKRSGATSLAELAKLQGVQPENICDILARYAGTAEGLPEDMAINHDHYLYGSPKQKP